MAGRTRERGWPLASIAMAVVRSRLVGGAERVYAAGRFRARRARRQLGRRIGGVRERVPERDGVALTFDDGPDPRFTERLLGVLDDSGVRATFFCIGDRAREHPEILRAIVAAGHSVGSHSLTHADTWTLGSRELFRELRDGHRAVEHAIGRTSSLFRPPKGYLDLRVASAIRAAGLRSWMWSVDPNDWRVGATADGVVAGCAGVVAGDVVLLHDGIFEEPGSEAMDRSATLEAVPQIAEQIRGRGLELTALAM